MAGRGGPAEAADESRLRGWSILPFLTGSSKEAAAEGDLREILDHSKSFRDYTDRLKKGGYEVRPAAKGD